ncbi:MAG: Na+-transporting NADH:ubiquinone oxidoreductase subunit A [Halieaceae bacterium]|jgi:Na+-transporting NADH:ubiquinone oxidoreductase subunit A
MIKLKRGMDIPISGAPRQLIEDAAAPRAVAVLGPDYIGVKPTMAVAVGDRVSKGQLLFSDKDTVGVGFTAPAAGIVSAINRGARRVLHSVVIECEGDESVQFASHSADQIASLDRAQIEQQLLESGMWTALRARPFSTIATPGTEPSSIFVNAMDTQPLAADPMQIIGAEPDAFAAGLDVLSRLTRGNVFVCHAPGAQPNIGTASNVSLHGFAGPHPAGLVGTHIHFLDPAGPGKTVWSTSYQDVIAIGHLFSDGELFSERVVALSGPQVESPRLLRTCLGVDLEQLTAGELKPGKNRILSGSVLGGRIARGSMAYLGRYHQQVSVLREGYERELFGWLSPGANKHSSLGIYLSRFFKGKKFDLTTTTNGSERAMVPMGTYEQVMPLDILPTQLLRALIVGDTETAQALGCMELEEEDLALCSYVCPGKYEYGPILRDNLTRIAKEG